MAISNYRAVLRSAVRGLWSGAIDAGQFDENMRLAISRYLTEAFAAGAKECGIRMDELTVDEQLVLADILTAETAFVAGFATAIEEGSRANDGKLTPLFTRLEMWVNRYNDVKNQAKILTCKDIKLEWIYGDVNIHCSTCLKLNGKVKRASQWEASGIYPQRPPNPNLECGGWRCQCTLQQTDKPVSKGPLPRVSQPSDTTTVSPTILPETEISPIIGTEDQPFQDNIPESANSGWEKNITRNEKESAYKYTGVEGYKDLNYRLNNDYQLTPEQENMVKDLDSLIEKAGKFNRPVSVYRGIKTDQPFIGEITSFMSEEDAQKLTDKWAQNTFNPGDKIEVKGFQSTSFYVAPASDAAMSKNLPPGPIFHIKATKGAYLDENFGLSKWDDEGELLLPRNTTYRVTRVIPSAKLQTAEDMLYGTDFTRTVIEVVQE